MKSSSAAFRILAFALLGAVALYFGIQAYRYSTDPYSTTLAFTSTSEVSISLNGWLVRREEPLQGPSGTLQQLQREGEKVGAGQTVAMVYSDASALSTVSQIQEQELQLEQLQFALESYLDSDAALKLDSSITDSILTLREEVSGGDYSTSSENISALKAAILKRSHTYTSSEEIQASIDRVKAELSRLRASLSGASAVIAPQSGFYSAACDGYESVLTPDMLSQLVPSQLGSLSADQSGSSPIGKMIYGSTWYYAAVVTDEQARQVEEGQEVSLRFAKGLDVDAAATVYALNREEDGKRVLILRCDRYLSQTTQLRHQQAELILHSYSGLRIPANALRMSEDGQAGVYCVVGRMASFKPVSVVYQGDGYTLVRADSSAQGSSILRAGDEVIVTASAIESGQVVQ